jgi:hypothetical protein
MTIAVASTAVLPIARRRQAVIPRLSKSPDSESTGTGENVDVESTSRATDPRQRRGRRPSHAEHWTKVTVVLLDRQIVFLDRLVADIRAATGVALSRAHLVRALVDALAESDIDLTSTRSEKELTKTLTDRLRRSPAPPNR